MGDRYEANIVTVQQWASEHITREQGQALEDKYPGIGNDPEVIKLIHSWAMRR